MESMRCPNLVAKDNPSREAFPYKAVIASNGNLARGPFFEGNQTTQSVARCSKVPDARITEAYVEETCEGGSLVFSKCAHFAKQAAAAGATDEQLIQIQ